MIRSFDTLVTRLLLVSLVGISLVHVLSLWTYEHALDQNLALAHETRLAERLISIKRSVTLVPAAKREELAHDLSGGPIEAHWSNTRGAVPGGPGAEVWHGLIAQIRALAQDLGPADAVIGTSADPHVALLSLRLPDDSWLNISLFATNRSQASSHGTLLSTSLMALGVILISLMMASWLTRPLRRIADAVATMSPDGPAADVAESGPKEVRNLAIAFNDMRRRIADLMLRRTRSLAAVSHDLRTPLTRLKLRIDDVKDQDLHRAMASDVDEMEQMIDATLSYLRGDQTSEAVRPLDLVAALETIINDARDTGRDATLVAPPHAIVHARLVGTKRAFSNLVANALRFGSQVTATIGTTDTDVVVRINDNGPGIPDDKLAAVLEPFVRLEDSRNAETGGVGLGLTIAKAVIEADGGSLELHNLPGGGLSAVVRLPRPAV